jgi:hypothetical protein
MSLSTRDSLFVVVVLCVVAVLAFGTLFGKGQDTPFDELHWPGYRAIKNGVRQAEVERACADCHTKSSLAYSKKHPPKEQCLMCHKLIKEPA